LAPAASTDDRLAGEVTALERAHQALAAHNHEAALHLLDRYRTQFPRGALASEETVLRVQALLASGDRAGAQALADAHSAAHPDSPYGRRLEDLVPRGQLPTP
jgi:outer membrane protein assembly factor BamD (BamD/ComL family)